MRYAINKIIMPTKRNQLFPLGILAETVSAVFMKLLLYSGLKLKGHKQKQDTRSPHSFATFKPITQLSQWQGKALLLPYSRNTISLF